MHSDFDLIELVWYWTIGGASSFSGCDLIFKLLELCLENTILYLKFVYFSIPILSILK